MGEEIAKEIRQITEELKERFGFPNEEEKAGIIKAFGGEELLIKAATMWAGNHHIESNELSNIIRAFKTAFGLGYLACKKEGENGN